MWRNVAVAVLLVQGVAGALEAQRNLPAEERLMDEAAALIRGPRVLWLDGPYVADVCTLYSSIGRRDKADSLLQYSLAVARRENVPATLVALLAWEGRDSMEQGRLKEAASDFREAIGIAETAKLGKLAELLDDLAQVESRLGHSKESEALLLRKASVPPERREPMMCESACCSLLSLGPEPVSLSWLQSFFDGRGRPDKAEEILRLLVEESTGGPMAERFARLSEMQQYLFLHYRGAEGSEISKTQIALLSESGSPQRNSCVEELLEPLATRWGRQPVPALDDPIRQEIADSARAAGGSDIRYIRTLDPRVEAALEKADFAAAGKALDDLREAAVKNRDRRTKYLIWRSRRAVVEACLQAEKFDLAGKLIERHVADSQAWFGPAENYYYTGALSLRLDLAMRQKDFATANALLPGFLDLAGEVRDSGFDRMGLQWKIQLIAWKDGGNR